MVIQIITSGALADAPQNLPRDLPVVIHGPELPGTPHLVCSVGVREFYKARKEDCGFLVDPAKTPCDGREIVKVLSFEWEQFPVPLIGPAVVTY